MITLNGRPAGAPDRGRHRHTASLAFRVGAWRAAIGQVIRIVLVHKFSDPDLSSREHRATYYRQLWSTAAAEVRVDVAPLPDDGLRLSRGRRWVEVREAHCSVDGPDTLRRAGDKVLVSRLLAEAGLPVPPQESLSLATLGRARSFFEDAPGPCVVKPAKDTGAGQGVTTHVASLRDLRRACGVAAGAGALAAVAGASGGRVERLGELLRAIATAPVVVERQISGADYRLLYLDGVLIDAIRRDPPTVTGDGRSTVGALLDKVNQGRLLAGGADGQRLVTRDLELERTLDAQGLTVNAVPSAGAVVTLKTTTNENAPRGNRPARADLCDELVDEGRRAAEAVGVRLAGVDVLTVDPARSLAASGGCILEVNTTPGLAMHHHGHPGQVDVAAVMVRQLFGLTPG